MGSSGVSRWLTLVERELAADEVRLLSDEPPLGTDRCIVVPIPDGRSLVATFSDPPADRPAMVRRLEMLVRSFHELLAESAPDRPKERLPMTLSAHLGALVERASAVDGVVIDAKSPVVWGAATMLDVSLVLGLAETGEGLPANDRADIPQERLLRAIEDVRGLGRAAELTKGRHFRHVVSTEALAYAAHSFAGIYILVLVFDGPFDELRAERCILEALPTIERFVLALPPRDPTPEPRASSASKRRR